MSQELLSVRLWREGFRFLAGTPGIDIACEGSTKEEAVENLRSAIALLGNGTLPQVKTVNPPGTGP